jgi:hypothetical protein
LDTTDTKGSSNPDPEDHLKSPRALVGSGVFFIFGACIWYSVFCGIMVLMNPQVPAQQNPQPDYGFIMDSGHSPKKGPLKLDSKKSRIIAILGMGVGIIVLIVIGTSIFSALTNKSSKAVVDLLAYQSELKRVIALGVDKSRDSTTKNKAITASLALEYDYARTVKIVNSRRLKPSKVDLVKYRGQATDKALDAADKANKFDDKYNEIYKEKLTKYKTKLSEVYPLLRPAEQKIIKADSNNAKVLLGEPLLATTK